MPILNFLTSDTMYNLARGPFVRAAFVLFAAGCLIRIIRVLSLTKKWEPGWSIPQSMEKSKTPIGKSHFRIKLTIFGTNPAIMTVSTVFHVLIFISPIFLLAHNILLQEAIGVSFFSLPQGLSNIIAFIILGCGVFFLFRRIFLQRMRAISSIYDYLILFIVIIPFLTGLLAFYQVYDYRLMVVLHMLSGELVLAAIPFTKIFHMVFFFVGRFVLVDQYTLGKGTRTW